MRSVNDIMHHLSHLKTNDWQDDLYLKGL